MSKRDAGKILVLTLSGVLLFAALLAGQPTRIKVLGDTTIREQEEVILLQIGFNFPVEYIKHFPPYSGNELLIKVEPIAVPAVDRDALHRREAILLQPHEISGSVEIVYEGDIADGPFLHVLFSHKKSFRIRQGADYRNVTVVILENEDVENSGGN